MSSSSQPEREIQALRERIAALSTAILRVTASLDVDTVLHQIAESARALTGARYAVIVTIDQARALEDAVTSGFTPDERRQVEGWTDNLQASRVMVAVRMRATMSISPDRTAAPSPVGMLMRNSTAWGRRALRRPRLGTGRRRSRRSLRPPGSRTRGWRRWWRRPGVHDAAPCLGGAGSARTSRRTRPRRWRSVARSSPLASATETASSVRAPIRVANCSPFGR